MKNKSVAHTMFYKANAVLKAGSLSENVRRLTEAIVHCRAKSWGFERSQFPLSESRDKRRTLFKEKLM